MRRNALVGLFVLIAAAVVLWYVWPGSASSPPGQTRVSVGPGQTLGGAVAHGSGSAGAAGGTKRSEARARADQLREQIARHLASAPVAQSSGPAPSLPPSTEPRTPGHLRNNLGGREALVEHLNREFMPLASECIEQAQDRAPQLSGMVGISLETMSDEQHGGVIAAADPAPSNTVADPLLLECIRESALSVSLPPPLTSGREKFEITLRVVPHVDADGP